MAVPLLLIQKLQNAQLPEEAKKELSAGVSDAYSKCICPTCPSYYICEAAVETNEPVLYCNPMRGKSGSITRELGCLCNACPVYKMNHFTGDGWYCTRGPAKEMVAMMGGLMGQARQVPKIEPEGTMCIDEKRQTMMVTVGLPGVARNDIDLRIRDTGFDLTAKGHDVEFVDSHSFECLVRPDKAKVTFKDQVLEISIPLKSKPAKKRNNDRQK